jgi:allantoicase
VFIPGKFTSRGKWMDGWESRRRRGPGHDWCVVQLGARGRIQGFDIDTSFFTGNFPPECSVEAVDLPRPPPRGFKAWNALPWTSILPRTALGGDRHNYLEQDLPSRRQAGKTDPPAWTHVRLNIYPDGGVARLRVHGEVAVDWSRLIARGRPIDLAEIRHGGLVLAASDMHYGARDNMILPGPGRDMGDGWETRRRRGPGHDWAILRLGAPGLIRRVEIDTRHFKGNYPDRASLEGCLAPGATGERLEAAAWRELLPQTPLRAHHRHMFTLDSPPGSVSHVRLNIYPDGGVSRLRIHGILAPA